MSARRVRVGIVGTRESDPAWWQIVSGFIHDLDENDIIVTGDCPTGVDKMARTIAIDLGRSLVVFHARWGAVGRRAGPERNVSLVEYVDRLIALPFGESRGTRGAIHLATLAKKFVATLELTR